MNGSSVHESVHDSGALAAHVRAVEEFQRQVLARLERMERKLDAKGTLQPV